MRSIAAALIAISVFAAVGGGAPSPVRASTPFNDISASRFKPDIEWLYAEGITTGCSPTQYCPGSPVAREQMASFLARMFALPPSGNDYFTDDEWSVHEGDINRLAAAGITTGCTATTFCPSALVSRAQMASFIVRAAHITVGARRNYFNDDDGNLHEVNIDRAAGAGITSGCAAWRYCPSSSVTRGEMAAFLHRIVAPVAPPSYPAPDADLSLGELLSRLPVSSENRTGYNRDLFTHWIDADGDGCNTRYEVLIAEATTAPSVGEACTLSGGAWLSMYDNVVFTDPGQLHVDHVVALAEAWDSGAYAWAATRRQAFANDLDVAWSLIAVSASSNLSKSDDDPAEWLPPNSSYWCSYLGDWLAVKIRWSLSVDAAERSEIDALIDACPSERRPARLAP